MLDRDELRLQFPLTREYAYFNTAATGLVPQATVEAMKDYWETTPYPYGLGGEQDEEQPDTKKLAAELLGADESEVGFVQNTSQGLSIAAASLPLSPGDEVVIPAREFPSVAYPFLYEAERRDLEVRFVEWEGYGPTAAQLEAALTSRTRVLALSWVQYLNGYTHDLKAVGELCAKNDVYLVVDAIQGLGAVPINLSELKVAVLASGAFKWLLAGKGSGLVYVNSDVVQSMDPGYANYRGFDADLEEEGYPLDMHEDVRRFSLGTPNEPGVRALGSSLEFLLEVGIEELNQHVTGLAERIKHTVKERGYTLHTRMEESSPIVAFTTGTTRRDEALLEELKEHKVWACIRGLGLRLSPHLYCTEEAVELVLDLL